jgi:hypothetical protein
MLSSPYLYEKDSPGFSSKTSKSPSGPFLELPLVIFIDSEVWFVQMISEPRSDATSKFCLAVGLIISITAVAWSPNETGMEKKDDTITKNANSKTNFINFEIFFVI